MILTIGSMMMSWSYEEDAAPIMLIVSTSVCLEPVAGDGEAGDEEPECMEAATLPSSPSTVTQVCRYLDITMVDMHRYLLSIYTVPRLPPPPRSPARAPRS